MTSRHELGLFLDQNLWPESLLGVIPRDLWPHIHSYQLALKMFQDKQPALKNRYTLKYRFGHDDLSGPYGVAVHRDSGEIFVADSALHRICVFSPTGKWERSIGKSGRGNGELQAPFDVVFDFEGKLIIADSGNRRVQVFDTEFNYKFQFGKERFKDPCAVAIDNEGDIVVTDIEKDILQFFSSKDGTFLRSIGKAATPDHFNRPKIPPGELLQAVGVAVSPNGNIIVVEQGSHRVQIFDPSGRSIRVIGDEEGPEEGRFSLPWGLVLDRDGRIIVTDQLNYRHDYTILNGAYAFRIQVFSPDGDYQMKIEQHPKIFPRKAVLGLDGNLIIAPFSGNEMYLFEGHD